MPPQMKDLAQILLMFILFFTIGLITRAPALSIDAVFGIHAVLAAPLYSALVALSVSARKRILPTFAAASLYGLCLGAMHPVMAVSAVVPAVCSALVYITTAGMRESAHVVASALAFGASVYPATLVSAVAFGSYHISPGLSEIADIALLFSIAAFGSLVAAIVCEMIVSQARQVSLQNPESESR